MPSSLKLVSSKKKHKKLSENLVETKPAVIEGMKFTTKYIGTTLVDSGKGEEMSAAAIKRIFNTHKSNAKETPIVILTISAKGIEIKDKTTEEVLNNVDIARISFCTADKAIGKVFGFVAQNSITEAFECHAYMCASRKEAQVLTLTVAQAFSIAYELSNNEDENMKDISISDSTSPGISTENKTISSIYRSIADSRYKRLSDSFEPTINAEGGDKTITQLGSIDDANAVNAPSDEISTLPSNFPIQPTLTVREKVASDVIVSITPPPSVKGKQSSRIRNPPTTSSLIDMSPTDLAKAEEDTSTVKQQAESENLDFDFAELALSRK